MGLPELSAGDDVGDALVARDRGRLRDRFTVPPLCPVRACWTEPQGKRTAGIPRIPTRRCCRSCRRAVFPASAKLIPGRAPASQTVRQCAPHSCRVIAPSMRRCPSEKHRASAAPRASGQTTAAQRAGRANRSGASRERAGRPIAGSTGITSADLRCGPAAREVDCDAVTHCAPE